MDRGMISLKFAMLRNSSAGLRKAGWVVGALLVIATWTVAVLADGDGVRHSALTLVLLFWAVGGLFGPVMMSGAGVLRPDYFSLLPIPRAVLGRSLLVTVFVGVASAYVLLAMLATSWHAWQLAPATIPLALVGGILTWIFVITLSRLTYGLLGAAMSIAMLPTVGAIVWAAIDESLLSSIVAAVVGVVNGFLAAWL